MDRFFVKELAVFFKAMCLLILILSCSQGRADLKNLSVEQKKKIMEKVKRDLSYISSVVEVGESKKKIVRALGKPHEITKSSDGDVLFRCFLYKVGKYCSYVVYFDKNDVVVGYGFNGYREVEDLLEMRISGGAYSRGDYD